MAHYSSVPTESEDHIHETRETDRHSGHPSPIAYDTEPTTRREVSPLGMERSIDGQKGDSSTDTLGMNASKHSQGTTHSQSQTDPSARDIRPRKLKSRWLPVGEILGLIFILPFVALIILSIIWHGNPVDKDDWDSLQIAMKIALTVFPLVFSAVVGHAIRQIVNQKLERGAPLGTLEQLNGSMTVFGTISTQFTLRGYNFLGLALVLLWLVSPFGGQASLYLIKAERLEHKTSPDVQYLDINELSKAPNVSSLLELEQPLIGMYLASLLAPESVKLGNTDLWGNVKIPLIRSLARDQEAQSDGWYKTTGKNITHSSLAGVPMFGVHARGNSTFNLETSYLDTDCFKIENTNVSLSYIKSSTFWLAPTSPLNITRTLNGSVTPEINFFSKKVGNIPSTIGTCYLTQVFVESKVSCTGSMSSTQRNCTVTDIRPSVKPHRSSNLPPLMYPTFDVWDDFAQGLANASKSVKRRYSSMTEGYLTTNDPTEASLYDLPFVDMPKEVISDHLTQIFNLFYLGSIALQLVTLGPNIPSQGNYSTDSEAYQAFDLSSLTNTTAQTVARDATSTYVVNWGWLAVMIFACLVVIGGSVVSFLVSRKTLNPDIVGYASTLTRNAPHLPGNIVGSTLSGFERARLLANVQIRLGDVQPESKAGKLGISTPSLAGRSNKEREYI